MAPSNGDTDHTWSVDGDDVVGLGSFHKTLKHNKYGEVDPCHFRDLVAATRGDGTGFTGLPKGPARPGGSTAALTNPQGGLAADRLTHHPTSYSMPPAPTVLSISTAAEMIELYWMALLRDVNLNALSRDPNIDIAIGDINKAFTAAVADSDPGKLRPGVDLPGSSATFGAFTADTLFRLGLPGELDGPMVSQFFVRPIAFGTQTIDQKQRPYKAKCDFLTVFADWLAAQNSGTDQHFQGYGKSNEHDGSFFETDLRYISTMRDLARFVNKDALHQAYFNAALLLMSGGAEWTPGNPYSTGGPLEGREAGFGVLGGPHILALVSEVATRALKVVWNQKWQVNLRLRPEAYGGLVHVQSKGVDGKTRSYGLPGTIMGSAAAAEVLKHNGGKSCLLPMAFTAGSPTHPAYGAGHATVAGACVTILKAYFKTIDDCGDPIKFSCLKERAGPFGKGDTIACYETGANPGTDGRRPLDAAVAATLTIEGELNKLAQNVAMGRSMGGVHWRSDNSRSLMLGEALAAEILADITNDVNENVRFSFRTFGRDANGNPGNVEIANGRIYVNGKLVDTHGSMLLEPAATTVPATGEALTS